MTDRERLINLINDVQDKGFIYPTEEEPSCNVNNTELADFLLANGVIVPPCKVGQTVYQTQPTRNRVQEYKVTALKFNGSCYFFSWVLKDRKGFYENVEGFSEFQIGATVFLTKEEALKALKGGEQ